MSEVFNSKSINPERDGMVCTGCGATLIFKAGAQALSCNYCGHIQEIESVTSSETAIKEHSYAEALRSGLSNAETLEKPVVSCTTCGATTTFPEGVSSEDCSFCGTPLVLKAGSLSKLLKPQGILPFDIDHKKASALYKEWLSELWFAPNDLGKRAKLEEAIKGVYLPHWTFDSKAKGTYSGLRGDDYYVQESYTDEQGNTQTRTVTKTRWTSVSGVLPHFFDDILVMASHSLPRSFAEDLEPWDLGKLQGFDERFLSGFRTETYQIPLADAFKVAEGRMEGQMRALICNEIGGDHQKIEHLDMEYKDITWKHILLPVWISSYKYKDTPYRFMINARTGEVRGERPYSIIKISLAVITGLLLAFLFYYFFNS